MSRLDAWLSSLPQQDGLHFASEARRFGDAEGSEEAYAGQFEVDEPYEASLHRGLERVVEEMDVERGGPVLEIGCGTGILSRGLVRLDGFGPCVLSDMSPAFLKATRATLPAGSAPDAVWLVLDSGDVDRVPARSCSIVALRYVLHHVLDWRAFIASAARLLKPGGALLMEEPTSDGYLLQAMASRLSRQDGDAPPAVEEDLRRFEETILWYLRRDVDKTQSEDKHLFRDSELLAACQGAGLLGRFYPNAGLDALGAGGPAADAFLQEFRHNLAVNFGFAGATLEWFDERVAPACEPLAVLGGHATGPYVKGTLVARKPSMRERVRRSAGRRAAAM